jgi:hypothetical protein
MEKQKQAILSFCLISSSTYPIFKMLVHWRTRIYLPGVGIKVLTPISASTYGLGSDRSPSIRGRKAFMDKTVKVLVIILIVGGVLFLGYQQLSKRQEQRLDAALQASQIQHRDELGKLEQEISSLQSELEKYREEQTQVAPENLTEIFGPQVGALGSQEADCKEINGQVRALFDYLDKKEYLKKHGFSSTAFDLWEDSLNLLANRPPVLTAEMDDLFRLMGNVTHLYRILGKGRILVVKEILASEADVLEPAMAVLFAWLTTCRKADAAASALPWLKNMYEYAGFFLNTLGGRSYLQRRDSKIRMLINYYSLIILDRANAEKLNSYGIDIRPHIDFLFYDISNQKGLMYRERYLSGLAALQNKYHKS